MTIVEPRTKKPREEIVSELVKRDGTKCQYPGCDHELDFSVTDGPNEVTIDHWIPQSWGFENGWTYDEVWALSNLKLMAKKCNAKKGDLMPNPDGTLPEKKTRTFKYRRDARAQRPEMCNACNNGRELGPDEICAACNSGPQPLRWPRWAKVPSRECLHDGTFWCWACASGVVPIRGATETILFGGEGGDE